MYWFVYVLDKDVWQNVRWQYVIESSNLYQFQKQSLANALQNSVLKSFEKTAANHRCRSIIFTKIACWRPPKGLQYRLFLPGLQNFEEQLFNRTPAVVNAFISIFKDCFFLLVLKLSEKIKWLGEENLPLKLSQKEESYACNILEQHSFRNSQRILANLLTVLWFCICWNENSFTLEKRAHYKLTCSSSKLLLTAMKKRISKLNQCLTEEKGSYCTCALTSMVN